jgi:hypothetical protein
MPLTFSTNAIDSGTTISYQRFATGACDASYVITGATGTQYTTSKSNSGEYLFSYSATDAQGLNSCAIVTGIWKDISNVTDPNITVDLAGTTGYTFTGFTGSITQQAKLGICSGDDTATYYTGFSTVKGDDYCIITTSAGKKIMLGVLNMNTNTPLLSFTGSSSSGMIFTGLNNKIYLSLQQSVLSGLDNLL